MTNQPRYNPQIHHRRSIRLKGYDYSQAGAYFITICTHNRECLFGEIVGANDIRPEMRLNEYGQTVRDEWLKTPALRPNVELGEWVVMPNHIHGIVVITSRGMSSTAPGGDVSPTAGRGVLQYAPTMADTDMGELSNAPTPKLQSPSQTIGAIVRGFKSATTKRINEMRINQGINNTPRPVWQRNYWEHIIRNEESYQHIAAYIINNPAQWEIDKLYLGGKP